MSFHASLLTSALALAAVCGWSSLLVNRGVANFNDAARPLLGERARGNMEREDLVQATREMSLTISLAGSPFVLVTAILVAWPVLIVADMIGVTLEAPLLAALAGAAWGAVVGMVAQGVYHGLEALPIDLIAALQAAFPIFMLGFTAIPVVACAYQFGTRAALTAGVAAAAVWLSTIKAVSHGMSPFGFFPRASTLAVYAGLVVLIGWAAVSDLHARSGEVRSEEASELELAGAGRVRSHLPWLAVQGAVLGFAARSFAMSWSQLDVVSIAAGYRGFAICLVVLVALGFWPASVTSALSTGVYQSVGLASVFAVAYACPNAPVAAVAGAAAISLEVLLLFRLHALLALLPTLRSVAESIRAAMEFVVPLVVLAGVVVAVSSITPGAVGVFIVVAFAVSNAQVLRLVWPGEGVLFAGIFTGLLANLLVWLGYFTAPKLG